MTAQEYFVNWGQGDLDGRAQARLVLQPMRVYARQDASAKKASTFPVYQTASRQHHSHGALPEGLYLCWLADMDDPALSPLTEAKRVALGEKRPLMAERSPLRPGSSGERLVIRSPLALGPGECGLNYGLPRPFPLPGTRPEGAEHVIRCLLPRFRPELSIRLWLAPEPAELLRLDDRRL